jgi:hypothetical protein
MTGATITPYLFFSGRREEALEFYHKAQGNGRSLVWAPAVSVTSPVHSSFGAAVAAQSSATREAETLSGSVHLL